MLDPNDLAHPTDAHELGDGLVLRWSTADDIEKIAALVGTVFRPSGDAPVNDRMIDLVHRQMRGDYPLMGPTDYALIEDRAREGHPAVACACLWHHTWEFAGIPFGVGRPEYVAVDPAYRNRGLMRHIFALLHARSAALGHRIQVITGINNFYRQFGYEYALDLEGMRVVNLSLIPDAPENEPEPYQLRAATVADIPQLMALQARRRPDMLIWGVRSEQHWRYELVELADMASPSKRSTLTMITDPANTVVGYLDVDVKRWGPYLYVAEFETAADVNLRAVLPPILRALQPQAQQVPAIRTKEPARGIGFMLGREHPVYEALGPERAPYYVPPYAWYIRVPDVPGFLSLITPVLEKRLKGSVLANYTGELKLDLYRSGVHLVFAQGNLVSVAPWLAPPFGDEATAGCPPLVFLQLLFGYRTLDELRSAFPDVWANEEAHILLNILFPKQPSLV